MKVLFKISIIIILLIISSSLFSNESDRFNHIIFNINNFSQQELFNNNYNFKDFLDQDNNPEMKLNLLQFDYYQKLKKYKFKKPENPIRRAEILFFGSLTFITFGGWFFFSVFNVLIYNDTFGTIRRQQFIPLYFGSCILSFSVVISDLVVHAKRKNKKIIIY